MIFIVGGSDRMNTNVCREFRKHSKEIGLNNDVTGANLEQILFNIERSRYDVHVCTCSRKLAEEWAPKFRKENHQMMVLILETAPNG